MVHWSRSAMCAAMAIGMAAGLFPHADAQPAASIAAVEAKGAVAGVVTYSDTKAPARLAQVLLIKIYPDNAAVDTKKTPGAKPDFFAGLTKGLNAMSRTFGQTGLDGRFELADVPAGKYMVMATQSGAVDPLARFDLARLNSIEVKHITEDQIKDMLPYLTVVTVEAGKTADTAVSLEHGASISGVLTYDDGSPAVGVQVHLMRKTSSGEYEEPAMLSLGSTLSSSSLAGNLTDSDGHFHVAGLAPGSYALRATLTLNLLKNLGANFKDMLFLGAASPDSMTVATRYNNELSIYSGNVFFPNDLKPIELSADEAYAGANITIPLRGMHTLKAHVEDSATNNPVKLAQVELLDAEGKQILRAGFVDDNGDCTFDYVPDGSYSLEVVNAVDESSFAHLNLQDFDPKQVVHYSPVETKVRVNGNTDNIMLRVTKVENKTGQQ